MALSDLRVTRNFDRYSEHDDRRVANTRVNSTTYGGGYAQGISSPNRDQRGGGNRAGGSGGTYTRGSFGGGVGGRRISHSGGGGAAGGRAYYPRSRGRGGYQRSTVPSLLGGSEHQQQTDLDEDDDAQMADGRTQQQRQQRRYNPYGGSSGGGGRTARAGGYRGRGTDWSRAGRGGGRGIGGSSTSSSLPYRGTGGYSRRTGGGYRSRGRGYYSNSGSYTTDTNDSKTWFKVTVRNAVNMDKEFLSRSLKNVVPVPFEIHNFVVSPDDLSSCEFLVQGSLAAYAISKPGLNVVAPNGTKLVISVKQCNDETQVNLVFDEVQTRNLQEVLSKRYDPVTKSLNLTSLYSDPDWVSTGSSITLSLGDSTVLTRIAQIVNHHNTQLENVCLDENKINSRTLSAIKEYFIGKLQPPATSVKRLSLAHNLIGSLNQVDDAFYDWRQELEEVSLEHNPASDRVTDWFSYVRSELLLTLVLSLMAIENFMTYFFAFLPIGVLDRRLD